MIETLIWIASIGGMFVLLIVSTVAQMLFQDRIHARHNPHRGTRLNAATGTVNVVADPPPYNL